MSATVFLHSYSIIGGKDIGAARICLVAKVRRPANLRSGGKLDLEPETADGCFIAKSQCCPDVSESASWRPLARETRGSLVAANLCLRQHFC
jgi:hypothetical protein